MGLNSALEELKQYPRWVNWEYQTTAKGERTKVPINCVTGGKASSTDPATWSPYELAHARSPQIGCMVALPYTGLDFDGCRDAVTGVIAPAACRMIEQLSSYTEISPSGKGVKIWTRARLPQGSGHSLPYDWESGQVVPRSRLKRGEKSKIEIFDCARYFTVTGEHVQGTPETIEDRQEQVDELCARLWPAKKNEAPRQEQAAPPSSGVLTEEDVHQRIEGMKNKAKFHRLASGDWAGFDSQSEGDMAYAQLLAYACDCDKGLMMRMFRQSGLWTERRAKEKAADYLDRTISKAIAQQATRYRPPRPRKQASHGHSHTYRPDRDAPVPDAAPEQAQEQPMSEVEQLNALIAHVFKTPDLKFLDEYEWRGDVIRLKTNRGWVEWPSSAELGDYKASRAIICTAVQEYLVGPDTKPQTSWDHAARLVVHLARRNRTMVLDPVAEEIADAITLNWNRSKCRVCGNNTDIIKCIEECSKPRDGWESAPPAVFLADYIYVVPLELRRWLGLPGVNGRSPEWATIRDGLQKLGFEPFPLCRREGGKKCQRRVWRASVNGPAGELLTKYVDDDPES